MQTAKLTLNSDQRMFVIESGGGVSCLGFDVVYNRAKELARRLLRAQTPEASTVSCEVTIDEVGTEAQYRQYQRLLSSYAKAGDVQTWFDADTPASIACAIEAYRRNERKVRLYYGDKATGRDWMEENDTIGFISRSTGPLRTPLLMSSRRASYGDAVLSACIVRIQDAVTKQDFWRHPTYHLPALRTRVNGKTPDDVRLLRQDDDGQWSLLLQGSDDYVQQWVLFIEGRTMSAPSRDI